MGGVGGGQTGVQVLVVGGGFGTYWGYLRCRCGRLTRRV